ncbi:MAG TPA: MFS transporter [Gammaproteobacteria bacterium]|nr:MFS transporter [Gammaproteobacteria bacterium]
MILLPRMATVVVVLVATAILFAGHSLLTALLGFRAHLEGFGTTLTGAMMSVYFLGYILGAFVCVKTVKQVGHIRTFAALAATYSAVATAHALTVTPASWTAFRLVSGICVVGLFLVIESWLNAEAEGRARGRLFGIYMMVYLTASAVGQLLLATADPAGFELFGLTAILAALAVVPVALVQVKAPPPHQPTGLRLHSLMRVAPIGLVGCLIDGVVGGSFWGMAAVFGGQVGLSAAQVGVFLSVTVVGGIVAQWPIGYLSDRTDRRLVLAIVAGLAGLSCAGLAVTPLPWFMVLTTLAFAFGALTFPLYSLSVALVHDVLEPKHALEATRGLMLVYGVGAMVGPITSGVAMDHLGPRALYVLLGLLCLGLAGYVGLRVRRTPPPVTPVEQSTLLPAVRTSQEAIELGIEGMHPEERTD